MSKSIFLLRHCKQKHLDQFRLDWSKKYKYKKKALILKNHENMHLHALTSNMQKIWEIRFYIWTIYKIKQILAKLIFL